MTSITKFIEKKLGLKVNMEKSRISRPNQVLGFGFYFDSRIRNRMYGGVRGEAG